LAQVTRWVRASDYGCVVYAYSVELNASWLQLFFMFMVFYTRAVEQLSTAPLNVSIAYPTRKIIPNQH